MSYPENCSENYCSDCLNVLGWVVSVRIVLPYLILVFTYFCTNLKPSTPKEKLLPRL